MATYTTRGTVTVNAAFLQEIKDVHQELWQLLRQLRARVTQTPKGRRQCRELAGAVARLRDLLALHFSLEEAYGYFDEPAEVAPRLSERAQALREEHRDLYVRACRMAELSEALAERSRLAAVPSRLGIVFRDFDQRLMVHEEGEAELIQSAYQTDIGVGD